MRKTKMALAFCLITALLFSPLAGMDEYGANVVVTKKDGTLARGQLLAVKRDALVVSASETATGGSVSIAIEDIGNVKVNAKSVGKGILGVVLIGAGGLPLCNRAFHRGGSQLKIDSYSLTDLLVLALGGIILTDALADKTFRFENLSKEDREAALLQLSNYAAIKGVR